MSIPKELLYTKTHEWIRVEGNMSVIGLTHYAQDQLGTVVFVELPEVGQEVEVEEEFCAVESNKSASDLYAPLGGTVVEINEELEDAPELINEDPYDKGWLVKIEGTPGDDLLDAAAYQELVEEESA